jgi:hypothetical protein
MIGSQEAQRDGLSFIGEGMTRTEDAEGGQEKLFRDVGQAKWERIALGTRSDDFSRRFHGKSD